MRFKKILIAAALVIVVSIVVLYAFLLTYDFNKFKPMIAQAVKNATGRELTMSGNVEFELGIRPTLIVEDVSFQNASWSSTPDLARVKRMEVQIAVLPLIIGKFDFAHLVLVEPAVIVEFDSSGTSNFSFDTATTGEDGASELPPPPLIFSDVLIEKGLFTYKDAQSDFNFSVRIDRLVADIPGFDKPLQLDFKGAFDDIPLTLDGTVGPIWAWVEPGYSLPANLTATASGATATITGELRDAINFKNLAFDISARGSSVAEIARLAGLSDVPELGAFKLSARVSDPEDHLGIEKLNIQIGTEELAAMSLTGDVKDLFALQGINLNFSARGNDSANLTQLGLPALPERGAFQVTAQISDPVAKVYTLSDLRVVLGENEVNGQVDLNLAEKVSFLTAGLTSQKFRYGQLKLDLKMTGPIEKPAIEKIDLKIGNPDLVKIHLNGKVDNLVELQGVDIKFQASGKDLANLKQVIGQPLPVRGAFSAAGKVLIPVHQNLKIPDLKITIGKNNISGSLNLNFRGDRPNLEAKLSLPKLDLPSVLLPELAKQGWAKGLGQVRPLKLDVRLEGFAPEIALKKVDLQAGTLDSAELRLAGSIENLVARRGIDLKFSLRGKEYAKLKEIIAQPYIFAPVPGQGAYAISGKISEPTTNHFKINDFKYVLADTELSGRLDFNLAGQLPVYEVELSSPKFNLKPFPIPKEAAYANLNKIEDLGPLKLHSKVIVGKQGLSLQQLDLQAGSEQLAAVDVKGSIKDLTTQSGIDLNFNIWGNEVANLKKITGQSIPLKGAYGLSGKFTDLAQKKYKLSDLKLKLGENNITGTLDLDLSGQQLRMATALSTPKFTLQPVAIPAIEPLASIEDLGPLQLKASLAGTSQKMALENLDLNIGSQRLIEVMLKGKINDLQAASGMELDISLRGDDLASFAALGGPALPFQGAFHVSGRFIDPAPRIYKIPSLDAVWGDNDSRGWITLDLSADRPHLSAELSSHKLDLRPLFEKSAEKSLSGPPAAKAASKKEKFFSSKPFELEKLKAFDADIKLRDNKQILLPALALDDVIIDILLDNGNLTLEPFAFKAGGGKADVRLELRLQDTPPTLVLAKVIDQLDVGVMLEKLGYSRSLEGMLDTKINLVGRGASPAELMAGLNGFVVITMVDGQADDKYLALLEKYLGSNVLQLLNPFKARRESAPINCFVSRIQIKDGLADVKLLLDTDQTSIFGVGDVNLRTEKLDLGIKPTPKKGAGISGVSSVSFSLKELSQPFKLGGTLAHPLLAVDPGRTAWMLGKLAGALALGPAGWAAFFADISVGKQDPCPLALEAAAKISQPADGKKEDQTSKKTDSGSEKEKKSGGFFQRLFGK